MLKEKLWVFSMVAGIIAAISLLAPAWGVIVPSYSFFVWVWGLEVSTDMGINFLPGAFLTYGITCTILIWVGAALLISSSVTYKKYKKKTKYIWLIAALLIIITSVIYVVGLELEYPGLLGEENHSTTLIGPLVSGILAILAEIIYLYNQRK